MKNKNSTHGSLNWGAKKWKIKENQLKLHNKKKFPQELSKIVRWNVSVPAKTAPKHKAKTMKYFIFSSEFELVWWNSNCSR